MGELAYQDKRGLDGVTAPRQLQAQATLPDRRRRVHGPVLHDHRSGPSLAVAAAPPQAGPERLDLQLHRIQPIHSQAGLPIQRVPITRSMAKIINETEFTQEGVELNNEINRMEFVLRTKKYGDQVIKGIIKAILEKKKVEANTNEYQTEINQNDYVVNVMDHGGLDNYEDNNKIEKYLTEKIKGYGQASEKSGTAIDMEDDVGNPSQQKSIYQFARKGGTLSGPKDYDSSNFGPFEGVSYRLSGKGSINFKATESHTKWSDPVVGGSCVDLASAGVAINKTDRGQHFALGDYIYAQSKGQPYASYTTNLRKGKWTWHHLETPYYMVLVDMNVHAKHGHNGGVYLW